MVRILKYILLLPITLILVSCADEPTVAPVIAENPITLATRDGGNIGNPALATDYNMFVSAFLHNDDNSFYFKNELFKYDTPNAVWRSNEGGAYYPLSGTLDFVAYASQKSTKLPDFRELSTTGSGENEYINMIQMNFRGINNYNLDGDDDVLISQVSQGKPCGLNAEENVPLEFIHLLSNVEFRFRAKTTNAAEYLRITGVEISNAYLTGMVTVIRDSKDDKWGTPTWTNFPKSKSSKKISPESPIVPPDGSESPVYIDFYLPPQVIKKDVDNPTKNDVPKFTIYYQYEVGDNVGKELVYVLNEDFPTPYGIKPHEEFSWEVGKRHIYTINCIIYPNIEFQVNYDETDLGDEETPKPLVIDKWTDEWTDEHGNEASKEL